RRACGGAAQSRNAAAGEDAGADRRAPPPARHEAVLSRRVHTDARLRADKLNCLDPWIYPDDPIALTRAAATASEALRESPSVPTAVAGPEIERLIQLLARLPGLGPRS